MGNTTDSTGKPTYQPTPTQTVADLQAAVDYAEAIGGLLKLTATQRGDLTSGQVKPGWLISETDTGYVYLSTASVPQGVLIGATPVTGTITDLPSGVVWDAALRRRGNTVTLNGKVYRPEGWGAFTDPDMTVGKIPDGFRSARVEEFVVGSGLRAAGGGALWVPAHVYFLADGTIKIRPGGVTDVTLVGFFISWERA